MVFTYSGPFTKSKRKKFKETGDSKYIYQNELDKACFEHNMAYGHFKDLLIRTAADKLLRVKHLILLKIQNMMGINIELLWWFISFFDKKDSGCTVKSEIMSNQ